ncbi:MAG: hypothetical protein GX542_02230 [Rhodococcus sp.]|nr:hypothetical protein [Rhodococcus sp. (in: high G+C Gram-positive bacteria)]
MTRPEVPENDGLEQLTPIDDLDDGAPTDDEAADMSILEASEADALEQRREVPLDEDYPHEQ